jgi:hypothetical protein
MDPFLEQYWGDVHLSMITYAREAIQPELPGGLVARIGERVLVELDEAYVRDIVPDVRVVEYGRREEPGLRLSNGVAVAEPLVVHLAQDEPVRQGFIEIIDIKSGRRVVTVIEVLSPSNKLAGPGREQYLKKQEELRAGGVSLVEIDLLRTGSRVLSVPFRRLPESHRTPYAACVRRGWRSFEAEFYRIPLRERLPAIAIPLRRDDRDIPLDLQAVLDRCYEVACYGDVIDYHEEPDPPLPPDDARWADPLLREKGLRA